MPGTTEQAHENIEGSLAIDQPGQNLTLDHELLDDTVEGAALVAKALLPCTQGPATPMPSCRVG